MEEDINRLHVRRRGESPVTRTSGEHPLDPGAPARQLYTTCSRSRARSAIGAWSTQEASDATARGGPERECRAQLSVLAQ